MFQTESITAPKTNVIVSHDTVNKPFVVGASIFKEMGKIKRVGTQGRHSEYHRIWNETHPDDLIIAGDGNVIHHIDENPNNNSPDNLLKMTDVEHKKHHTNNGKHPNQGITFSQELCDKLSESHLGQVPWNKGKTDYLSDESRWAMGSGSRGKPSACGMQDKKHSQETRKKMSGKIPWNKGKKGVQTAWNKGLKKDDYGKK
jgi:hypothetical protein